MQVGLFYNKDCQKEAAALISNWTMDEMHTMRKEVGTFLATTFICFFIAEYVELCTLNGLQQD